MRRHWAAYRRSPEGVARKARNREVGAAVRRARESAGLSRRDLAELVGITRSHVNNVERGDSAVAPDALTRIAKALRTTPAALQRSVK